MFGNTTQIRSIFVIPISLLLIIVSNFLGHIWPPTSILLSPVLIPIVVLRILRVSNLRGADKIVVISIFVALNDFLIRLYAGGDHDSQGNGIVILAFLVGAGISLVLVVRYLLRYYGKSLRSFSVLIICIILLSCYFVTCRTFGMSWVESPSSSLESAKESGKYLGDLTVHGNLQTDKAWYEKTVRINHERPIKHREITDQITYILEVSSDELNEERRYIIPNGSTGYYWLNKRVEFRLDKEFEEVKMVLTDADDIKIKTDSVMILRH